MGEKKKAGAMLVRLVLATGTGFFHVVKKTKRLQNSQIKASCESSCFVHWGKDEVSDILVFHFFWLMYWHFIRIFVLIMINLISWYLNDYIGLCFLLYIYLSFDIFAFSNTLTMKASNVNAKLRYNMICIRSLDRLVGLRKIYGKLQLPFIDLVKD